MNIARLNLERLEKGLMEAGSRTNAVAYATIADLMGYDEEDVPDKQLYNSAGGTFDLTSLRPFFRDNPRENSKMKILSSKEIEFFNAAKPFMKVSRWDVKGRRMLLQKYFPDQYGDKGKTPLTFDTKRETINRSFCRKFNSLKKKVK